MVKLVLTCAAALGVFYVWPVAGSAGGNCGPIGEVATDQQIVCLAANAGFPAGPAVRIARAESSGRIHVSHYSPENGTIDYGLMEINSSWGYSTSCLYDPQCNMNAAEHVREIQGLNAWATWAEGTA